MSEGGEEQKYKLEVDGEARESSREYTGNGTATYPNGETYEGEFKDGLRDGHGKYTYVNGDVYEGDWVENFKHGIGKIDYKDKGTYYGDWVKGKRHGEGLFTYLNKDLYSGNWENGNKQGVGTFIFFDTGMKLYGNWKSGKFVDGKWIYPNGTYFEGKYDNNRPKGKGKWHFNNGNTVDGEYSQMIKVNTDINDPNLPDEQKLVWRTK